MRSVSDFDLRLLRIFKTVADCGGLSAAQSILDMNLSTISVHISNLEKRVGFKVCQRGRSGFKLTPGGMELYASAEQLFRSVGTFRESVGYLKQKLSGELSIGIIDGLISDRQFLITESIGYVKSKSDDIFIRLEVMPPNQLGHRLEEGFIDIGVGPCDLSSMSIKSDVLYEEDLCLHCARGHVLFDTDTQESHLLRSGKTFDCVSRGYLRESLQPRYIAALRTAAVVHSMEAAAMLILSGHYIGFLPEHFASRWKQAGELVPVLPHMTSHKVPLGLLYRHDYAPSPAARILMDRLLSATGPARH